MATSTCPCASATNSAGSLQSAYPTVRRPEVPAPPAQSVIRDDQVRCTLPRRLQCFEQGEHRLCEMRVRQTAVLMPDVHAVHPPHITTHRSTRWSTHPHGFGRLIDLEARDRGTARLRPRGHCLMHRQERPAGCPVAKRSVPRASTTSSEHGSHPGPCASNALLRGDRIHALDESAVVAESRALSTMRSNTSSSVHSRESETPKSNCRSCARNRPMWARLFSRGVATRTGDPHSVEVPGQDRAIGSYPRCGLRLRLIASSSKRLLLLTLQPSHSAMSSFIDLQCVAGDSRRRGDIEGIDTVRHRYEHGRVGGIDGRPPAARRPRCP